MYFGPLSNVAVWFDSNIDSSTTSRDRSTDNTDEKTSTRSRTVRRRAVSNTRKTDRGYSISVEMPGVTRSDLDVNVESGLLTVVGNRVVDEYNTVSYFNTWVIGENVVVQGITARCEAGILELFVPTMNTEKLKITID